MRLSKRLQSVADLVQGTGCVADVGTDHGWIPIYLVREGRCQKAIALDVKQGPLMRAKEHIGQYGLEQLIETRLSDGVSALQIGEAQSVVLAGMGGNLVIHILEQGASLVASVEECILQPQSEIAKVRFFLRKNGWRMTHESMILEDGKYYPMMRAVPRQVECPDNSETQRTQLFDQFGRLLLEQQNQTLYLFLQSEMKKTQEILQKLRKNSIKNTKRIQELEEKRRLIEAAFLFFN